MRLVVFSHKRCWPCDSSPCGYATDGGFPFQMRALSELFDTTIEVLPCDLAGRREGEIALTGHNLSVVPLSVPKGAGVWRKLGLPFWFARNGWRMIRELVRADAVHTPIPGDIGTIGMLLALAMRKPLFVRYCGNWFVERTTAERFWKWFMERFTGGRNVMLATGGAPIPPSPRNANLHWIFSTSLTEGQLAACAASLREKSESYPRLAITCRQENGKGTDVVIKALGLVLTDFPGATLDVVGDGSALESLRQLALSLKLTQRIVFHGKLTHGKVIEVLRGAHVFCYPTLSEGFPKVVLEALACGLPVISTHVSVIPQLISNGAGLLIDEPTPVALANAIREVLKDEQGYRRMSLAAVKTAQQYSLERWRDTIGDLLRHSWGRLNCDA